MVSHLMKYEGKSKVRMTALNVLAGMLDQEDIAPLRELFLQVDKDHTGFITVEELKEALEKSKFDLNEE
mgnify:CR=1 FL=1